MLLTHYKRQDYGELKTRKIAKRKWALLEDWQTPFGVVPKGFISNGANVPRFLWWFLDPATEAFEASILHDYMYDYAIQTKPYADLAFYRTLQIYGVSEHKALPAYWAVKGFGNGKYPRR